MNRQGWCKHQAQRMCRQTYSAIGLVYLASIRRHPAQWIAHSPCNTADHCIGYNVDNETFQGVHVEMNCECEPVAAHEADMLAILKSGGVPVVRCKLRGLDRLTLQHVRASPSAYTAISHLWADGLGNPSGNTLPRCQLERLVNWVSKAARSATTGSGNLFRKAFTRSHIDFWLDIYCVPVVKRNTLAPLTDDSIRTEELQRLKAAALSRMLAVYSWAESVLVLDHELSYITSSHDELELLGRVAISGWNSRYWTFQEYCLSRGTTFQSGEGPRWQFPRTHSMKMKNLSTELSAGTFSNQSAPSRSIRAPTGRTL